MPTCPMPGLTNGHAQRSRRPRVDMLPRPGHHPVSLGHAPPCPGPLDMFPSRPNLPRTCPTLPGTTGHDANMPNVGPDQWTSPRGLARPRWTCPAVTPAKGGHLPQPSDFHRTATRIRLRHGSSKRSSAPVWCESTPATRRRSARAPTSSPDGTSIEHFAEAERVAPGTGAAAVPRVHGHVVVVAAGRDEQRRPCQLAVVSKPSVST